MPLRAGERDGERDGERRPDRDRELESIVRVLVIDGCRRSRREEALLRVEADVLGAAREARLEPAGGVR